MLGKSSLSVYQGTGPEVNPLEDLGHPRLNEQLIPLREQRTRLEEKKGQAKKVKKKSPKKKGALKNARTLGTSEFDPDEATSAYTGYTSEFDKQLEAKDRITVDYFPMQGKARTFRARTATLSMLGIENYDNCKNVEQLNPKVRDAINFSKKHFGTVDVDKIKRLMRLGIVREVSQIEGRKNAQLYQQKRNAAFNYWDDDY